MNESVSSRHPARGWSLALVLGLLVMVSLPRPALAAGKLDLTTEAFKEVEKAGPDGKVTKVMVPLKTASPGEQVIYVITYHNIGNEPAENVKINNPVPKGLVYMGGTAQGTGTRIDFSVDNGAHYGALENLNILANGQMRAARPEDVTNVRWTLTASLKPEAKASVSYRALLP
jgi:uncharacterized repeat protein (TIGR01451 family)